MQHQPSTPTRLRLWGALDCTVDRVLDAYFSQMAGTGCGGRRDDLERFAALGVQGLRYPLPWERIAPRRLDAADWRWPDLRLPALRRLGITPIVGLVHNGALPRHVRLAGHDFGWQLAQYAGAVARRYPWIEHYTPIGTPQVTARFAAAEAGPPRAQDEAAFVRALLSQCRAVVLAMRAVRGVNPHARLVQTEEPGKAWGTAEMASLAAFHNERRWLTWDLLCGHVDRRHPLYDYLLGAGAAPAELLWFRDHPCAPDIVGIQHGPGSERWLDHRGERYPARYLRAGGAAAYADIEAAHALASPAPGIEPLCVEAWERYRLPLALTEARIDPNREDQLRWLREMWDGAHGAAARGADVRAVTVSSLLGSYDWHSLATHCRGAYAAGAFAVRGPRVRPTALAQMIGLLAGGCALPHPVLQQQGWWRGVARFRCAPVASNRVVADLAARRRATRAPAQPILVAGALGALGSAFGRICEQRNLACQLLSRHQLDIADPVAVAAAIARYRPWAIVNAAGQSSIDQAEADPLRCYRDNVLGPGVLAAASARHALRLVTFSSDQVFDGRLRGPYVETDLPAPLNVYGHCQAEAERNVRAAHPAALIVRSSALFGPWDEGDFVARALAALGRGEAFVAPADLVISPTYVPDLVHACLDLLIDGEAGIWHLTNCEPLTWAELARRACAHAGVTITHLDARPFAQLGRAARRPVCSPLYSEKEILLPPLEDALARCVRHRLHPEEQGWAGQAADYSR